MCQTRRIEKTGRSGTIALLASASLMLLVPLAAAQPQIDVGLDLEDLLGSTGEIDPGRPRSEFDVKTLIVDSNSEFVLVQYTQRIDDGPELTKLGWMFLSNDRKINYKMGMVTLLRDAIANPDRPVFIQIAPGTADTSRPIISSVGASPMPN